MFFSKILVQVAPYLNRQAIPGIFVGANPYLGDWQLYFSDGLKGPFLALFDEGVDDCHEFSGDSNDDVFVWFTNIAKSIGEGFQGGIVVAGQGRPH